MSIFFHRGNRTLGILLAAGALWTAGCDRRGAVPAEWASTIQCDSAQWRPERMYARRDVLDRLGRRSQFPDSVARWLRVGENDVVVGLGWQAPRAGAVLLFDCGGRLRGGAESGAVDTMWQVPPVPGLPPIVAIRSRAQATSYQDTTLTVFAVAGDTLRHAWSTRTYTESNANGTPVVRSTTVRFTGDAITERGIDDGRPVLRRYRWNARAATYVAESALIFTQDFYDEYASAADGENADPAWMVMLRRHESAFSPALAAALRADHAARLRAPGEIVGLDFDPILNTQDPCERYEVGRISSGGGAYRADIHAVCSGRRSEKADVIAEVVPMNGGWAFANFHYTSRRIDLLTLLKPSRQPK